MNDRPNRAWCAHILASLKEGPTGGGNQFLKALKKDLREHACYSDDPWTADVILINSFPFDDLRILLELIQLRRAGKRVVHRLDGPISIVRGRDRIIDHLIVRLNRTFAEASIFQTEWSRKKCVDLGVYPKNIEEVVINGCDDSIFYPSQNTAAKADEKIKVIATSWSSNTKKGFDIYQFLDAHLDHSKYKMTFVGNTPVPFKNIKILPPVTSKELGDLLRTQQIYITASVDDPCSNSLIEALACGLKVVVRNSGGHLEIAGETSESFQSSDDVLLALERARTKLVEPVNSNLEVFSIKTAGARYRSFFEKVLSSQKAGTPSAMKLYSEYLLIIGLYGLWYSWTYLKQAVSKRLAT